MHRLMRFSSLRLAWLSCVASSSLAAIGCTNHPPQSAAAQAPAREHQVIVKLVSRNYSVVISEGPQSPLYTIRGATGQLLASNLTLNQLRDSRPDLYNALAPALSPKASAMADVDARK